MIDKTQNSLQIQGDFVYGFDWTLRTLRFGVRWPTDRPMLCICNGSPRYRLNGSPTHLVVMCSFKCYIMVSRASCCREKDQVLYSMLYHLPTGTANRAAERLTSESLTKTAFYSLCASLHEILRVSPHAVSEYVHDRCLALA